MGTTMDNDNKKRIAAALAAIRAHRAGEEALQENQPLPVKPAAALPNLWGLASRQDRMNQRQFWEFRPRRY